MSSRSPDSGCPSMRPGTGAPSGGGGTSSDARNTSCISSTKWLSARAAPPGRQEWLSSSARNVSRLPDPTCAFHVTTVSGSSGDRAGMLRSGRVTTTGGPTAEHQRSSARRSPSRSGPNQRITASSILRASHRAGSDAEAVTGGSTGRMAWDTEQPAHRTARAAAHAWTIDRSDAGTPRLTAHPR